MNRSEARAADDLPAANDASDRPSRGAVVGKIGHGFDSGPRRWIAGPGMRPLQSLFAAETVYGSKTATGR